MLLVPSQKILSRRSFLIHTKKIQLLTTRFKVVQLPCLINLNFVVISWGSPCDYRENVETIRWHQKRMEYALTQIRFKIKFYWLCSFNNMWKLHPLSFDQTLKCATWNPLYPLNLFFNVIKTVTKVMQKLVKFMRSSSNCIPDYWA